ncbi:unnamed protein product [Pleuronectes platessa]|uniref:Uncharacterized protein n=1 Tax=Pleuronectes platessa TaxID=8262 RepID=A0A9N7U0R0_PLEPL|nr:unnamed protein product [Pleuronectes platessa]
MGSGQARCVQLTSGSGRDNGGQACMGRTKQRPPDSRPLMWEGLQAWEHRAGVRRVGVGRRRRAKHFHLTSWDNVKSTTSLRPPTPHFTSICRGTSPTAGYWCGGLGVRTENSPSREENVEERIYCILGVFLVLARFEECEAKLN